MDQMNQKPELLSPAGDEASLRAAVCAGADAVYLGYSAFGARASAKNFDAEALEKAVAYAHLYHVRVHVTVNTLVKQKELEDVYQALCAIDCCHADAIIVQDLGVAAMAKECFPALKLHASTQMSLCSGYGARFAKDFGFERVVLARECPLEEITRVCETGIDTEVFVHGALCAGVSGQCLMSSLSGGRSGNRGRCAQPCRQLVTLDGEIKAFLSMRDLMLRDKLGALIGAGVRSFKIEGRLKRPEYVSVVTASYRKALDQLLGGNAVRTDDAEKQELMQAYHRGGFTQGHAFHAQDAELCSIQRVGHGGVEIGHVSAVKNNMAFLRLTKPLHDGDGLQLRGQTDVDVRYSGPEKAAGQEAALRLREDSPVRAGDTVTRLTDAMQDARAISIKEKEIPVSLLARIYPDKAMTLSASDGNASVTVMGEAAQTPRTHPLSKQDVIKQLSKLGDTPFTAQSIQVELGQAFAATSIINALRRDALIALQKERIKRFENGRDHSEGQENPIPMPTAESIACEGVKPPRLLARTTDAALCQSLLDAGAEAVVYAPTDYTRLDEQLSALPPKFALELAPQMFTPDLEQALAFVDRNRDRLLFVALGSVDQLGASWPVPIALGSGIPVCNRLAAKALMDKPVHYFTLWPELSWQEMEDMALKGAPAQLTIYGRETVMLLGHCPARVKLGLKSGHEQCALCDSSDSRALKGKALRDRKGYVFPMMPTRMHRGCVISVLSSMPVDLSKHLDKQARLQAGAMLRFTVETPEDQISITQRFYQLQSGSAVPNTSGETTTGRFLRGVE